jgi:hypothetical protein
LETGDELCLFPGLGNLVRRWGDPEGRLALSSGAGSLRLYDDADGGMVYALRGITNAALLHDARRAVFGCCNGRLQLGRLPDRLAVGR